MTKEIEIWINFLEKVKNKELNEVFMDNILELDYCKCGEMIKGHNGDHSATPAVGLEYLEGDEVTFIAKGALGYLKTQKGHLLDRDETLEVVVPCEKEEADRVTVKIISASESKIEFEVVD